MVKCANVFQSHMVLQRDKAVRIWGESDEPDGTQVLLAINGIEATETVKNGKWQGTISPQPACSTGTTLTVTIQDSRQIIEDVLFGDVYLASGQSNMEFQLRYDENRKNCVDYPLIRQYSVPKQAFVGQAEEYSDSVFGVWRVATQENLDYFSAVAYYFAEEIYNRQDLPIGIIDCDWGATPACAWMDPKYLRGSAGEVWLRDYDEGVRHLDLPKYEQQFNESRNPFLENPFANNFMERMLYGLTPEEYAAMIEQYSDGTAPKPLPVGPKSEKRPGALYEYMLKTVASYTVRGVLWYQGENDDIHADVYETVLTALIRNWRELWEERLPFFIVQLAPFGYWQDTGRDRFPIIRAAQARVAANVPDVYMAAIMDAGLRDDIHPKCKRIPGQRLARLAINHLYEEDIACEAPVGDAITVEDGRAVIHMLHTDGELEIRGEKLSALEVSVHEVGLESFDTKISGCDIVIESEAIRKKNSLCVRFAETDFCTVNLYNKSGLAARPFTLCYRPEGARI